MTDGTLYSKIATQILNAQISVIGPLAVDQARLVTGITVDTATNSVTVKGNGKEALDTLVKQFEQLFGQASVEVCKDAVRELHLTIAAEDLPDSLH